MDVGRRQELLRVEVRSFVKPRCGNAGFSDHVGEADVKITNNPLTGSFNTDNRSTCRWMRPSGARRELSIQSDGQRNMQLVNGAVRRNLVSIPRDGMFVTGELRPHRCEVVAYVANVAWMMPSLHFNNERLRLIKRGVDILQSAAFSIQPANVDRKSGPLRRH